MDVMQRKNVEEMVSRGVLPGFVERFGLCCEGLLVEEDSFL